MILFPVLKPTLTAAMAQRDQALQQDMLTGLKEAVQPTIKNDLGTEEEGGVKMESGYYATFKN